jgi:hypothetical protein
MLKLRNFFNDSTTKFIEIEFLNEKTNKKSPELFNSGLFFKI